jgi:hypothetical protein
MLNDDSTIISFLTMATTYDFPVEFEGIDEVSSVKLKSNINYLESLKFRVEYMHAQKYAKFIKIHKFFYYESCIDLAGESVGFDDAEKKHYWRELESDDDVHYLFRTIEDDPSQARLYTTLSTV